MDVGLSVRKQENGAYMVGAGTLMGVTVGAEIAIYGSEPRFFHPVGSPEDQPIGRLRIVEAERSRSVGEALGSAFELPQGARGRLVKPGESEQLRVCLKPDNPALAAILEDSPLLAVVEPSDAEVEVVALAGGGWRIGSRTEPSVAVVPADEEETLRIGLEHYYRCNTVLRMAHNLADTELRNALHVELLDCNNSAQLQAMSAQMPADPPMPSASRSQDGSYELPLGFKFCIRVANNSSHSLNVTLLNCSAGGLVEYLSDALIRSGASHVMWLHNNLGDPFETWPEAMPAAPDVPVSGTTVDQLIAIGTTRHDENLKHLALDKTVQAVIDERTRALQRGVGRPVGAPPAKTTAAPAEMWTATVTPFHLPRQVIDS
jgi:hypothetical protein